MSTYEAMAADYVAELEESPFNALYERPGVIALLPDSCRQASARCRVRLGSISDWLVRHGAEVVGFNSSPTMTQAAKRGNCRMRRSA